MTDQTVIDALVILAALGFLRFGNVLSEYICRALDPAPDIIEEDQP